jgi:hypothetical protein
MTPARKFSAQKASAKRAAIAFLLTFEEWRDAWMRSGHWNERGKRRGEYVLARIDHRGPFALGNIHIVRAEANLRSRILSDEAKARIGFAAAARAKMRLFQQRRHAA